MLREQKGNMYEFVTHTWNPIKGRCPHDCSYCYMKRWGKQDPIKLDERELKTDLGSGNFIFVGSSCDMFAEDIPSKWIISVLEYCEKFDNKYLFQTKNPKAFSEFGVWIASLLDFVLCTTIESNEYYPEIMRNAPDPMERATEFSNILWRKKHITIEPIMDFNIGSFFYMIEMCNPVQVNIGADSGGNNLPEPNKKKILDLIETLNSFTKVHQKKNLNRLIK